MWEKIFQSGHSAVQTFLVTDTMENKKNLPVETEYKGTLADLLKFVEAIE